MGRWVAAARVHHVIAARGSVACRGSSMPGDKEVLGCPGQGKSHKFLYFLKKV